MIGNHDDRSAFRNAFPNMPLDDVGSVQVAFEMLAGRFILLDTHEAGHAG